jgi:hypothetical protein
MWWVRDPSVLHHFRIGRADPDTEATRSSDFRKFRRHDSVNAIVVFHGDVMTDARHDAAIVVYRGMLQVKEPAG